ncbi:MAG TPA: hypothetical protein PKE13_07135 [Hyphomicrobium zavarzinii]|nr:hypothetical protein [Hyphomicrobium zavarzinii]
MPFDSLIHPLSGLAVLYHHLGDMSAYDIDGPVPEIDDPNHRSISSNVMAVVRRDNLSIRQLYQLIHGHIPAGRKNFQHHRKITSG